MIINKFGYGISWSVGAEHNFYAEAGRFKRMRTVKYYNSLIIQNMYGTWYTYTNRIRKMKNLEETQRAVDTSKVRFRMVSKQIRTENTADTFPSFLILRVRFVLSSGKRDI